MSNKSYRIISSNYSTLEVVERSSKQMTCMVSKPTTRDLIIEGINVRSNSKNNLKYMGLLLNEGDVSSNVNINFEDGECKIGKLKSVNYSSKDGKECLLLEITNLTQKDDYAKKLNSYNDVKILNQNVNIDYFSFFPLEAEPPYCFTRRIVLAAKIKELITEYNKACVPISSVDQLLYNYSS